MSQPYRVIIVDDEPPARDLLAVFVERVPDLQCVTTCANAFQALDAIQQLKPDLAFLDILMPEMTGMDLMKLPVANRPAIILTTAYPQYALSSYEFDVLDYLMKPIAFERFMKAIVKFKEKQVQSTGWIAVKPPDPVSVTTNSLPLTDSSIWLREEKRKKKRAANYRRP